MPRFSDISKQRLNTCDIKLQRLFNKVIENYDVHIACGHRTQREQDFLFNQNPPVTKVRWPKSKHNSNPSQAVDVYPWPLVWPDPKDQFYYKQLARWYNMAGYVEGVARGLEIHITWGGDWDRDRIFHDQVFDDLPHFELLNL